MDLLTPIVPQKDWHPHFAAMIKRPNPWNAAILKQWANGFEDRDGKFVREFQTTFNSCFWELYLNAALRERKLLVNFDFSSPDFTVTGSRPFTMEATIASNAQGDLPEHRRAEAQLPGDFNEFNRQTIIRLSNSLSSKHQKFKAHYAGLPHVAGKPFVIAVTAFDRPYFWLACQRAIEAVLFNYYVDEERYISCREKGSPIPREFLPSVQKDNQACVELGVFQNGAMPEVSAVLFSSCATWGKVRALSEDPNPEIFFTAGRFNPQSAYPRVVQCQKSSYQETLLDGLRVYHNPEAQRPLDPEIFRSPEVFQSYYCHQSGEWVYEHQEGQLLFRGVMTCERKPGG